MSNEIHQTNKNLTVKEHTLFPKGYDDIAIKATYIIKTDNGKVMHLYIYMRLRKHLEASKCALECLFIVYLSDTVVSFMNEYYKYIFSSTKTYLRNLIPCHA